MKKNNALSASVLFILMALLAAGCVGPAVRPVPGPTPQPLPREAPPTPLPSLPPETSPAPPPPPPRPAAPPKESSPRMVASLRLTEEARILLESGKPDQAIRTLERAMNMSPSNGQNFYYLSEAWLMKKNIRQAEEFNRLAALHLKNDPQWTSRVADQAERIKKSKQ